MPTTLKFLVLLTISNTFMTMAWYGHLKDRKQPILIAVLTSWMIALAEYAFQVPANRIGSARFTLTQLKIMQECVALSVFLLYAYLVFRETPRWNTFLALLCLVGAVYFAHSRTNGDEAKTTGRRTP